VYSSKCCSDQVSGNALPERQIKALDEGELDRVAKSIGRQRRDRFAAFISVHLPDGIGQSAAPGGRSGETAAPKA